jgi:sugar fermentation stimulation protein A
MESDLRSCQIRFRNLVEAEFVQRDNRFRVQVNVGGQVVPAHLPNSGRLSELLVAGRRLWLTPAPAGARARRKTAYDVTLVKCSDCLVSVDARLPSSLVAAALYCDRLDRWSDYVMIQREVSHGASRLDLRLDGAKDVPPCWIEVKSVTLVENGVALFPDAPTARGRRHMEELIEILRAGERAAAVFVVQRDDPERFKPHPTADPAFAAALSQANAAGVNILAYRCHVTLEGIELTGSIPVIV